MGENRSVFLMVAVVVIVCVGVFIVIASFAWRVIERPVNRIVSEVSRIIRVGNTNYNFPLPVAQSSTGTPVIETSKPIDFQEIFAASLHDVNPDITYNFNFRVPRRDDTIDPAQFKIRDAILEDAIIASYASNLGDPQSKIRVQIPSIAVDSSVWQGLGAEALLEKGFWVYPSSSETGTGEIALLCHRRYFGPNDPRTCWYLDKVQKEDPIYMMYEDTTLQYRVTDIKTFDANDPEIYNLSRTKDAIRIVTCTPLYSDAQRLVVMAERVK